LKETGRFKLLIPGTIILAHLLWFATFYLTCSSFLDQNHPFRLDAGRHIAMGAAQQRQTDSAGHKGAIPGVAAAIALYVIFWAGKKFPRCSFLCGGQIKDIIPTGIQAAFPCGLSSLYFFLSRTE
jgi:hypothetical protein